MLTLVCTFSNWENDCQTFIIAIILCVAFTKTSGVAYTRDEWRGAGSEALGFTAESANPHLQQHLTLSELNSETT